MQNMMQVFGNMGVSDTPTLALSCRWPELSLCNPKVSWTETPTWSFEDVTMPLVNDVLVVVDAPRQANPLFPRNADAARSSLHHKYWLAVMDVRGTELC